MSAPPPASTPASLLTLLLGRCREKLQAAHIELKGFQKLPFYSITVYLLWFLSVVYFCLLIFKTSLLLMFSGLG